MAFPAQIADTVLHHLPRHGIDRRLAHRDGQAGLGDAANTLTTMKDNPTATFAGSDRHPDLSTVCDIGIITGIFDNTCCPASGINAAVTDIEMGRFAGRGINGDGLGNSPIPLPCRLRMWPP